MLNLRRRVYGDLNDLDLGSDVWDVTLWIHVYLKLLYKCEMYGDAIAYLFIKWLDKTRISILLKNLGFFTLNKANFQSITSWLGARAKIRK